MVRIDPRVLAEDLKLAAKACDLDWSDVGLFQAGDPGRRHHESAAMNREAEEAFYELSRLLVSQDSPESPEQLELDRETRENALQNLLAEMCQKVQYFSAMAEQYREQSLDDRRKVEEYSTSVAQRDAQYQQLDLDNCERVAELESQLALIANSRTWRWRKRLAAMPPLNWLANMRDLKSAKSSKCPCSTRATRAMSPSPDDASLADVASVDRPCAIIIPVYNAFAEALTCVRSVLKHTKAHHNILVIDDCSTEGRFADALPPEVLSDSRLCIQRNEENLGFVQTCNLGMRQTSPLDVVLLNSDTEVTSRWLDKLQEAAFSHPTIGTATPLTNSGTICSAPEFVRESDLPSGYDLDEYAALIEAVSAREYPELPTCVGFCVYIKREVLDKVGLFDETTFDKGYGEENDLSCRLQKAGYIDVLDDATFVYHRGKASFQERTADLVKRHLRLLDRKHPHYLGRVHGFIAANPLRPVHRRIQNRMLYQWNEKAQYTVLHILHNRPITGKLPNLPGGVEYHVADLIRGIPEAAHWSLHSACGEYRLIAHVPGCDCEFHATVKATDLLDLLSPDLFDVVHLHHVNGMNYQDLTDALLQHGRYFVSLHDFHLCCPLINLLTLDDRLCNGHECSTACRRRPAAIELLRSTTKDLLHHARAVFHFSQSTKDHFAAILGEGYPWKLIEHGIAVPTATGASRTGCAKPSERVPLKVAFVGGIGVNKGANLIRKIVKTRRLPSGQLVEWHLIGLIDGDIARSVRKHGRYERNNLPTIMNTVAPHFTAILSIWPETYCYTFDEALACGVPVICTPMGGPAERLKQYKCGWVSESLTAEGFLATLQRAVDDWDEYCEVRRRVAAVPLNQGDRIARHYHEFYREDCETSALPAAVRLATIRGQFTEGAGYSHLTWHRLAGRAVNAALAALRILKLQPLAMRLVRGLLSTAAQRKLVEMSHVGARSRAS